MATQRGFMPGGHSERQAAVRRERPLVADYFDDPSIPADLRAAHGALRQTLATVKQSTAVRVGAAAWGTDADHHAHAPRLRRVAATRSGRLHPVTRGASSSSARGASAHCVPAPHFDSEAGTRGHPAGVVAAESPAVDDGDRQLWMHRFDQMQALLRRERSDTQTLRTRLEAVEQVNASLLAVVAGQSTSSLQHTHTSASRGCPACAEEQQSTATAANVTTTWQMRPEAGYPETLEEEGPFYRMKYIEAMDKLHAKTQEWAKAQRECRRLTREIDLLRGVRRAPRASAHVDATLSDIPEGG
jgi:hypothetical protein